MTTVAAPNILFEALPTPAIEVSRSGKVMAMNPAARQLLGLDPSDVVGQPILGFVIAGDRDRTKEIFHRVLEGQRRDWTTRFLRGDRAFRAQRVRAVPVSEGGQVDRIVMFTRDLAATKEVPQESSQLHTLLENIPGHFTAVLDSAGRIRSTHGMARTHFRDDAELVGTPFTELLDPSEDGEPQLEALLKAASIGKTWMGTVWHKRADDVSFPVRTHGAPLVDRVDGRKVGALVVGRDASVEQMWRTRAHRAERLAAIGEFAVTVASRLAVETDVDDGSGAEERERTRLRALSSCLQQLGTESPDDRGPVSIRELAKEAAEPLLKRMKAGSISFNLNISDATPAAFADRTQLRKLLQELLENSIGAVGDAAKGWIRITAHPDGGDVIVQITDSGKPPPEASLHRLFEPFYTTASGRAGLGLLLARSLAQANDGKLWTDTDSEGRLVVALQLPAHRERKEGFKAEPLELAHDRTVLVVDDEEAIRTAMRRVLERVGYEVLEAWSGRSAIAAITGAERPDVVITDIRMRDGSGFWLLGEMERDFPELLRKTVIITGEPNHEEVQRLRSKTGCPVVAKPIELPEMLELLEELNRRE